MIPNRRSRASAFIATVSLFAVSTLMHSPAMANDGGSNNGGSGRASGLSPHIAEWCRGSQAILEAALSDAALLDLQQDSAGAVKLLLDGLDAALKAQLANPVFVQDSLTRRLIERGLDLGQALVIQAHQKRDNLEGVRKFMFSYYAFIKKALKEVDLPLYIPQHHCVNQQAPGCESFAEETYEALFATYARDELRLALRRFTSQAQAEGGIESHPYHSADFALKVMEHIALWAAEDLSKSIRAARYACVISELEQLNRKLASFNGGNKIQYGGNPRYAINLASDVIRALEDRISQGCPK